MDDDLKTRVYGIVADIPRGFVLTYGLLAVLAGVPRNARLIGRIMSQAPRDARSHRVVNYAGRTVPGWTGQRILLERDGVVFKANGCVDLKKHLWRTMPEV